MQESTPSPSGRPEGNLADEMARIPYEPLLPVEKKLIAWSLILGIALLGLLFWISSCYFTVRTE
jgi:hypothetical protein